MTWAELYSEAARPTLRKSTLCAYAPGRSRARIWRRPRADRGWSEAKRAVWSRMECEVPQGQQVSARSTCGLGL